MDYEKKYKEALDKAKAMIKNSHDHVLYENDIKSLFEELQETKSQRNERIRRAIMGCIEAYTTGYNLLVDDIKVPEALEWLESLSPKNKWMPSKEQMMSLSGALGKYGASDSIVDKEDEENLQTLYNDLKKYQKDNIC